MKVLNLLTSGGVGGIEVLCKDIGEFSDIENRFAFLYGKGNIFRQMELSHMDVSDMDTGQKLSVKRIQKLLATAKDCDVVVVHHDDPYLQIHYLILSYYYPEKKYITMVHHCYSLNGDENRYGGVKEKIRNNILKRMFSCSDRIVFVSKAGQASYDPYFRIETEKIRIVYNGISHKLIESGEGYRKQEIQGRKIRLYYIGRLVRIKGVDLLIEATARIRDRYDIELAIIGDGKERGELEKLVKKYHLEKMVTFRGFQEDVMPYLREADLFIYPSHTEIFGISVVEAMAFGNICIANSVGGLPEIIKDEKNGILNRKNDLEGLTEAIERGIKLLFDRPKADELRKNAQKTAAEFSIENTIQKLNQVYMELF